MAATESPGGQGTPPGWHQDPWDHAPFRYWDGAGWTGATARDASAAVPREPGGPPAHEAVKRGWWSKHWPWVVAGVVGFIVGAGAGAAGNTKKTKTATQVRTQTVTHTQTQTQTQTATSTKTAQATAPAPPPSNSGSGAGQSYSGNGEKNLGTVNVPVESVLDWKAAGGFFAINNDPSDSDTIDVNSNANSGSTTVAPGTYHKVDVLATDQWSFTLRPK